MAQAFGLVRIKAKIYLSRNNLKNIGSNKMSIFFKQTTNLFMLKPTKLLVLNHKTTK